MRAIGYIRVSTDEQAETGISLAAQEEKVRAYALAKGWPLTSIIRDEASAKDLRRPGIQAVLAGCKASPRPFDVIIITKLDRLTRSVRDLGYLVQDVFDRTGVAFSSIADNFDTTTANGKLALNILGSVAQWERDIISERTREALTHKRLVKRERVGLVPLGFDLGDDGKTLIVNNEEMALVRKIRALRAEGWGYARIARTMEEAGAKTKCGGRWRPWGVRYLLRNPLYAAAMPRA